MHINNIKSKYYVCNSSGYQTCILWYLCHSTVDQLKTVVKIIKSLKSVTPISQSIKPSQRDELLVAKTKTQNNTGRV